MRCRINTLLAALVALQTATSTTRAIDISWADGMFDTLEHDFGVVPRGYTKTTVTVTNVLNEPVRIRSVESECQSYWFLSETGPRWLAPGEAFELEVGVKRPFTRTGFVEFWFDKPRTGLTRIRLRADVRRDLVFESDRIALGTLRRGVQHEGSLVIKYAGKPDWTIKSARCPNPALDVRIEELTRLPTGSDTALIEYQLTVAVAADVPLGRLDEVIELQLDDHRNQTVTVVVEGTVVDSITSRGRIVTPLTTLNRDQRKCTVPIARGGTSAIEVDWDEEIPEEESFDEDYFVLRWTTASGREGARKFHSSYGRFSLDIVDLGGDETPELVLITGRGRGTAVRTEELQVLTLYGEQLEARLSVPYSGWIDLNVPWGYRHVYRQQEDGSTDIHLWHTSSAGEEDAVEGPVPNQVDRVLSIRSSASN